jgi:hypothetical protein
MHNMLPLAPNNAFLPRLLCLASTIARWQWFVTEPIQLVFTMFAPRLCLPLLAVSLSLAACMTQTTMVTDSPGAVPGGATAAAAQPAASPPPAAAPSPPPAASTPPPAGRAARAPTPPPPPPPADEQPMTITRAREQCWMAAESQRARDVDSRVKFVEKCVQDKMK